MALMHASQPQTRYYIWQDVPPLTAHTCSRKHRTAETRVTFGEEAGVGASAYSSVFTRQVDFWKSEAGAGFAPQRGGSMLFESPSEHIALRKQLTPAMLVASTIDV